LQAFPAVAAGELSAPDHEYPSRIELRLTATDSRGLAAIKTIDLYPRAVELEIASSPLGITLTAGPLTKPGPFELTAILGSQITLSAPATAKVGGEAYTWKSWSDGGARVHAIEAGSSTTEYTASYVAGPPDEEGASPVQPPVVKPPLPPQTEITRRPGKRTASRRARFAFSSSDPSAAFLCRLDRGGFRPCTTPRVYRRLLPGRHLFRVAASSGDGITDPTPAGVRWRVVR
jgi:hypothetical protein